MSRMFPIGMQTFSNLRERNAIYIDKTEHIYNLVTTGKVYFLSRPRRFGKSLLISTLQSYFEGEKELFQGLTIETLEKDWIQYPVLRFDMSLAKNKTLEDVRNQIDEQLRAYEVIYNCPKRYETFSLRLKGIIDSAYEKTGQKVVVLIDEYDAPLLDTIQDETFHKIRNVMRDFFSPLKACDAKLQFVFLTGITKFSQLSIFSELNNLNNISMDDEYCSLCGITMDEIQSQLQPEMQEMAETLHISQEELIIKLKQKYDGYHFSPHSEDIFNPFSLLNSLQKKELGDYWFSSGTPTFLVEKIQKNGIDPSSFDEGFEATIDSFDVPTESTTSLYPVLYQSGYLTLKKYDPTEILPYTLQYPNEEVKNGFLKCLMTGYTSFSADIYFTFIAKLVKSFRNKDINTAMELFRAFMSSIPYDAEQKNEHHYRTIIYLIFRIATPYLVHCEERSAAGRADVVIETATDIYVMEFKLDGSVDAALKQIDEKGYLLPYSANDKILHKIGINFDTNTRTIGEWKETICS